MGLRITKAQLSLLETSHKTQAMWSTILFICIVAGFTLTPLVIVAPWRTGGWWLATIIGSVIANHLRRSWRKQREQILDHIHKCQQEDGP